MYTDFKCIGQFETHPVGKQNYGFLSRGGRLSIFCEVRMKTQVKYITQGALLCALYVVLSLLQNLLLPGSTSFTIQVRVSEALCVLSFFTPAAIGGLTLGCLLFNLSYAATLPLDIPLGAFATFLSCAGMWLCRNIKTNGLPILGLSLPVLFNGLILGLEFTYYFGGGFLLTFVSVAAGEAIAVFLLGSVLYLSISRHRRFRK